MGGINSGRHRSVHRGAVEQYPAIDLRILRRARLLRPGECTYDTVYWRNEASNTLGARIFIDLSDTECASLRIIVSIRDGAIKYRIEIACVPCRFGGIRCYFICPINNTRCEQLYFADGTWASRQAHRLTYTSQTCDELSRARRKIKKLQKQLDGDGGHARVRGSNRWSKTQSLWEAKLKARIIYRERLRKLVERPS